ncbi:MAG: ATP-binding protein [Gammaproteobacteria bacterium]|nr:ATP-binding protein [Gammaproteobacteria bacterium]
MRVLNDKEKVQYAMRDIAYRSRISAFLYLVIFGIVIGFTPFYADYKSFITVIGILLLTGSLMRGVSAWNYVKVFPKYPTLWMLVNGIGLLVQAGTWGVLSIMSIEYYGWQWTTMVICLSSAAFSAGAVITVSTSLPLIVMYLVCMFVPTIIVTVINGTDESLIAALLFTTYFVFLLSAAKRLNNEYWEALDNTLLLKQRARELELKNRELESFTYSVSHDLRAPLRSIDGFSKLILEDAWQKLDDIEREYLQRVRAAAQKMGVLIDDLLLLSDVSRAVYKPEYVDLSRMVANNLEKLRQTDPNREIEVEVQPDIKATGDQSLLDIAVSNLVANAWKYSSKKPHAKIRFAAREQNGQVVYYIKDNGEGFDTRYINKLFRPFQRLHTDDEFPGTGIGLATVQRVIDRYGGKIWANAKVGRGATFYFALTNHMH